MRARIDQYQEEYGIPIVTFNADLEDTKRLCFVGQDTFQAGRTAAGLMWEMTGGNGQVAIISGQVANPGLISRQKGFTTEIKESFPGIEIVEEFLELYPELTGIYITGHGVKGVCQTLQKLGKDKTMHVIANDFLEENLKWLKEGTINFLIGQDAAVQGHSPVIILFQLLFDSKAPEKEYQYTDIVIRTKYNMG